MYLVFAFSLQCLMESIGKIKGAQPRKYGPDFLHKMHDSGLFLIRLADSHHSSTENNSKIFCTQSELASTM